MMMMRSCKSLSDRDNMLISNAQDTAYDLFSRMISSCAKYLDGTKFRLMGSICSTAGYLGGQDPEALSIDLL